MKLTICALTATLILAFPTYSYGGGRNLDFWTKPRMSVERNLGNYKRSLDTDYRSYQSPGIPSKSGQGSSVDSRTEAYKGNNGRQRTYHEKEWNGYIKGEKGPRLKAGAGFSWDF